MSTGTYLIYTLSVALVALAAVASARPQSCGGDTTDSKRQDHFYADSKIDMMQL